jgi:hypothetical protein
MSNEKQKESSFLKLMDGLTNALKFLIVTLVFYFIVGSAFAGFYQDWCKIKNKPVDGDAQDMWGNMAFLGFILLH